MANKKTRDDLSNEKALKLFGCIYQESKKQYVNLPESSLHIINDIAMLEQIKQECWAYILDEGVMVDWQNGANQGGKRENPLISKINQTTEQQRKLLNELKLTPASKKVKAVKTGNDDFENF